ncbi:hypothetical protein NC652_001092 [Populus alba x Populus x berolinensis]|nr:hypothetical protein NC652_001092 [Populus alba x Populus x berolinensis]
MKMLGKTLVDETEGERVKLACASWPSYVEPLLAEAQIVKNKYNCIRVTWATFMLLNVPSLL